MQSVQQAAHRNTQTNEEGDNDGMEKRRKKQQRRK
jgi:hypothetical protein